MKSQYTDTDKLLQSPDCNFSRAAAKVTGNLAAGMAIYIIKQFGPCTTYDVANNAWISYKVARLALQRLVDFRLIEEIPRKVRYHWVDDHPEQTEKYYQITPEGLKYAPRGARKAQDQEIEAPVMPAQEETYDGEEIAQECGLLDRFGGLTLTDYQLRTAHLTDKQKEVLREYIKEKQEQEE